jgi:hypothetical protein
LQMLFAYPIEGKRAITTARRLKAKGAKAGIPDIFFDYPVAGSQWPNSPSYHGLRIELKRRVGGVTTSEQMGWIEKYQKLGYRAEVCHGWVEAAQLICEYLGIKCEIC